MASALDNLGAHLLGKTYHEHDERDWPLEAVFAGAISPLDAALAAMLKRGSGANRATQAWAKIATQILDATAPAPIPVPTPTPPSPPSPSGLVFWTDTDQVLDQGQTGHCVGFGGTQWENTLPIDDKKANADGDNLYYQCKVNDKEPKAEDGSTVHSLATVLKGNGRLNAYAWASSIDDVIAWVTSHGPVVMGTDWYNDMFTPDANGLVSPTGGVAGGHCYVCVGWNPTTGELEYLNSWSAGWGLGGYFKIAKANAATLLKADGAEAMAAIELPLAS